MPNPTITLTTAQQRLVADILMSGLYPDRDALLTAALLLAKRHSDKALRFKADVDKGLADIAANRLELMPVRRGSLALPWLVTRCAFDDMDAIHRDDPIGPPDNPYGQVLNALAHQIKRPAYLFRRSYLPPDTALIFVWPYVCAIRSLPDRHELLRVLHGTIDVTDIHEPEQNEDMP